MPNYKVILTELMESTKLTTWEENFVESCSRQLEAKGQLSDKQMEIVDKLYMDKTPRMGTVGDRDTRMSPSEQKTSRIRNEGRD